MRGELLRFRASALLESIGSADQGIAQMGAGPAWAQFRQPFARAGVEEDQDSFGEAGFRIPLHRSLDKRPREAERQQTEHEAAQQQEEDILQPAATSDAWGGGHEEHEGTEDR